VRFFRERVELVSDWLLGIPIEDLWSQVITEARAKERNPEEGVPAVVLEEYRSPSNQ